MAAYYQNYSSGDIGQGYMPTPGYIGTMSEGLHMQEDNDTKLENLPHHILNPYPAFQEIQWHGRWPVPHPMIPHPVIWLALNNLYLDDYQKSELADEAKAEVTIGGRYMRAVDGMRIAKHTFGQSFDPAEQFSHGYYQSTDDKIPFYNPGHGPTYKPEEAHEFEVQVPPSIQHIVDLWHDPTNGTGFIDQGRVDIFGADDPIISSANDISYDDVAEEEKERLLRAKAADEYLRQHGYDVSSIMEKLTGGDKAVRDEEERDQLEIMRIQSTREARKKLRSKQKWEELRRIYQNVKETPKSLKRFLKLKQLKFIFESISFESNIPVDREFKEYQEEAQVLDEIYSRQTNKYMSDQDRLYDTIGKGR